MTFHFNLHHITLILIGYLSNISCSPLPFGLLFSQVSGNRITFRMWNCPVILVPVMWLRQSLELQKKSPVFLGLKLSFVVSLYFPPLWPSTVPVHTNHYFWGSRLWLVSTIKKKCIYSFSDRQCILRFLMILSESVFYSCFFRFSQFLVIIHFNGFVSSNKPVIQVSLSCHATGMLTFIINLVWIHVKY